MQHPRSQLAIPIVLSGSLMAASAAIWIRFIPEVSPLVIGFIRTTGAALLIFPWFRREWQRQTLSWRDLRLSVLCGVALAFHFATWIASVNRTTVALAGLLVATHPMFVILISFGLLRIKVAPNRIAGALLAFGGIVFIQWPYLAAGADGGWGGHGWGNLLALAGGFFAALYLLLGQAARNRLGTIIHVEITYATAGVVLLLAVLLTGETPVPLTARPWAFLALLILLPTLGGHTIFNWGLKHLGAPLVSLIGLVEPVFSTLLALIILHEGLPLSTIGGGIIILAGLALAVRSPAGPGLPVGPPRASGSLRP